MLAAVIKLKIMACVGTSSTINYLKEQSLTNLIYLKKYNYLAVVLLYL